MEPVTEVKRQLGGYLGADIEDNYLTGPPSQVLGQLRSSVSGYTRPGRAKHFYVGIASGADSESALRRRLDAYKRQLGINRMVCIYQSSSQNNSRLVEKELIDFFDEVEGIANRVGGGGGPDSAGPRFFVYLALAMN